LEGKVAVVTGGASGIGAATVRLFVAHGASVLIGDIQDKLGADLAQELAPNASFLHCDVTQEKDVEALVDAAVRKHGRLDIMYNNAGVIGPIDTSIQELQVEDMNKVYTVNVRGTLLAMKHAVRVMIPAKKGVILAMASVLGGTCPLLYTISKCAMAGLIKSASAELGQHGIRVNCISPSAVPTPFAFPFFQEQLLGITILELEDIMRHMSNLKGVLLLPEDIAKAALFQR
jgi:NAD(P)-dependent dehydrogenase (short-subunit alcohol dehydrogenase family)